MAAALAPYLAWLALVAAVVLAFPQTTQWLRGTPATLGGEHELADDEVERMMREMSARPADGASATER